MCLCKLSIQYFVTHLEMTFTKTFLLGHHSSNLWILRWASGSLAFLEILRWCELFQQRPATCILACVTNFSNLPVFVCYRVCWCYDLTTKCFVVCRIPSIPRFWSSACFSKVPWTFKNSKFKSQSYISLFDKSVVIFR